MKKWLSYIILAVVCGMGLASCTDENLVDGGGKVTSSPTFKLTLSLSGGTDEGALRAAGDYAGDEKDEQTDEQRYIANDDVYALEFDKDGVLQHVVSDLHFTDNDAQGKAKRTLEGTLVPLEGEITLVVLANLKQNGISDALEMLKDKIGNSKQEVYESLIYTYPTSEWDVTQRYLPMHGEVTTTLASQITNLNCNIYRGVAKMGVKNSAGNFTLKEIYVYYVNTQGYCVAPTKVPGADDQYTEPEVPATSGQRAISERLKYTIADGAAQECLNRIYVSEANNKTPGEGKSALKIVVGGVFTGEGLVEEDGMSYYRIDMEDDKTGEVAPFDIIRNHSYVFNITAVKNPGTPTPDEALDKDVISALVVGEWTTESMRGIPDQYTLTTDKSVIKFDSYSDLREKTLDIWTDYSDGWEIIKINDSDDLSWLNISSEAGTSDITATVSISPKKINRGISRVSRFYVMAGNIRKEITVIMPQPPTANCYIVGEGENELIVSIKGNGNDGIKPEDHNIIPNEGDASLKPAKIGIIWETNGGLVKLKDPNGNTVSNTAGELTLVDYNKETNSIKYEVSLNGASIGGVKGGNALIGAFNSSEEVIWSWHIWVCPDMIDSQTQEVKEQYVESWTLNDYDVLDRNLGALSNRPGTNNSVASMGLLYQWGRKDPFIGAGYSNDDFGGDGTLPVVHYYKKWGVINYSTVSSKKPTAIEETIANPTQLVYGKVSKGKAEGLSTLAKEGGYLWGTNGGLSATVKDLGSKTVYDPCPVGYRVPPVDAFVFSRREEIKTYERGELIEKGWLQSKNYNRPVYYRYSSYSWWSDMTLQEDGKIPNKSLYYEVYEANFVTSSWKTVLTSAEDNWRPNVMYVPHYVKDMQESRIQWGDENPATKDNIFLYKGDYVKDADYYGFYLNYKELKEPVLTTAKKSASNKNYYYSPKTGQPISWLPLTGAYDPTKGFGFKSDGKTIGIQQGSSITVNSFLWTNSSVENEDGRTIPAAMFLHGTETGGGGSGRHIHGLTQSNIKAEPHYAGAVRCVRDRAKTKWDINSLTETATIGSSEGSTTTIRIISVNADWEMTDPGAPWLQVTPDRGTADKGLGSAITLKMLESGHSGETTKLRFQIANETEPRYVTVTVR
mgnify:CR=1 FL=1